MRDIKAGRAVKGGGYYTWTIPDVEQYLAFHQMGSKARLALGLLLFSGARRQDMVDLGKQHCRGPSPDVLGDWIRYVPKKTLKKRRTVVQKPLLPVLQIIAYSPCGSMTFLETARQAFTGPVRQLVPRPLRRGRAVSLHRPWSQEGGRDDRGRERRHHGPTDGDVRLGRDHSGRGLHPRGRPEAACRRGHGLISLDRSENENCRTDDAGAVAPTKIAR